MQRTDLDILWRREKSITIQLQEVADLTNQIARAADRKDETSVTLLLSLREEPLTRLSQMDAALRESLLHLPQEDAIRARELLEGAAAETDEEVPLVQQTAQYRTLLRSVQDLDRRISLSVGGKRSFYNNFRE